MSSTLRKSDLASRVAGRLQGTRSAGEAAVNAVIGTVQSALASGDRVVITGFGSFEVRQIKERKVRPIRGARAGQQMTVPAHRRVCFSPGTELTRAASPHRAVQQAQALVRRYIPEGRSLADELLRERHRKGVTRA